MGSNSPLVMVEGSLDQPVGPAMSRIRSFLYQSYFSNGLGPNAILAQPTNSSGFVISTVVEEQIQGYGIALHPDSECPVAIQFRGGSGGDSGTFLLKPGQVIRPSGRDGGSFDGFKWGLPFGWLGGGLAHLVVLLTPDAKVDFPSGRPELVFHRQRITVLAPDAPFPTKPNWPVRFPWPSEIASLSGVLVDQRGNPLVAVEPTKVFLRLRNDALAATSSMRIVWQATDPLDQDFSGIPGTDLSYIDVTWPAITVSPPAAYPLIALETGEIDLGGDVAIVAFYDIAGGGLTGARVDVVRYGVL